MKRIRLFCIEVVSLIIIISFIGCTITPHPVTVKTEEPDAHISIEGGESGTGSVVFTPTEPAYNVTIRHEDYEEFTTSIEGEMKTYIDKKGFNLIFLPNIMISLGIVGLVLGIASPFEFEDYETGQKFYRTLLLSGGGTSAVGIAVLVSLLKRSPDWYPTYPINMTRYSLYDADGYHKKTGFNKDGYNREGYTPDGERYIGELTNGKRTGYGVYTWKDGRVYSGWFRYDKRSGWGVMKETDDSIYAGYWTGDKKHGLGAFYSNEGKAELQEWENGSLASSEPQNAKIIRPPGEWVYLSTEAANGLADGSGAAVSINGTREIRDGRFIQGILIEGTLKESDGTVYTGDFENGVLSYGEIRRKDGTVYEGELDVGVPQGTGRIRFSDGTEYTGDFQNGIFSGEGKLVRASGEMYEGPFVNGLPHGKGVFKKGSTIESCEYYEGNRIDQAYLIRVENEKREYERQQRELAEEEARRIAEEEERKRAEEAARHAEAERKKREAAEREKRTAAIGLGIISAALGGSAGMDAGEAALFGTSVAADVLEDNTDGKHMNEAKDTIIANRREGGSSGYSPSVSKTERSSDFTSYGNTGFTRQSTSPDRYNDEKDSTPETTEEFVISPFGDEDSRKEPVQDTQEEITVPEEKAKTFEPVRRNARARIISLVDREEKYSPGFQAEKTITNPQAGITRLTVRIWNKSFGGELQLGGAMKWAADEGYPEQLPGNPKVVVKLENSTNSFFIIIGDSAAIPASGKEYGLQFVSSPQKMMAEAVNGPSFSYFSADVCRSLFEDMHYTNYSITEAWVVW